MYILINIIIILLFFYFAFEDFIFTKLKTIKKLFMKAKNDPAIIRDISLGFFINGIFSMFNALSLIAFVLYGILTLSALVGIINANDKVKKDK